MNFRQRKLYLLGRGESFSDGKGFKGRGREWGKGREASSSLEMALIAVQGFGVLSFADR